MSEARETDNPPNPSETYESYLVPSLFGPATEPLIEVASPQPGERVLDVACGTGIGYRQAAPLVGPEGSLSGIDISPNMLAVAREVADQDGLAVELHEAEAEDLPFANDSFDLVICGLGLMWFEDERAALSEMRRVLTPGGRVALSIWQDLSEQDPFEQQLWATIADHLGLSSVDELDHPFVFGNEAELRTLLDDAGFEAVEVEHASFTSRYPNPEGWLRGTLSGVVEVIPSFDDLAESEQEALIDGIAEEMEPSVEELIIDDHVCEDAYLLLGRGNVPE